MRVKKQLKQTIRRCPMLQLVCFLTLTSSLSMKRSNRNSNWTALVEGYGSAGAKLLMDGIYACFGACLFAFKASADCITHGTQMV